MSSLSEHLYDKAHGRTFKVSKNVTDHLTTGDLIFAPPSGRKLCINQIQFQPLAASDAVSIKSYESDGTTVIETLFENVLVTGYILSVPTIDMSDCPIILNTDEMLRGIVAASGDQVYVTVRGFLL